MDVTFVPARPEEAEELSKLRHQVWQTTYRGIYPDAMIDGFDYAFHNERNRSAIRSSNDVVYFILADHEKIGYLILRRENPLRLQSLYLLAQYQRRGIGTMAFGLVRSYCQESGISQFVLDCHPQNLAALAFYAKMGGVITHRDEGHEHKEEDGLQLVFSMEED